MFSSLGALSVVFYLLSLTGLHHQLSSISKRKEAIATGSLAEGGATDGISLYYSTVAFLGTTVYFLYAFTLPELNHYLLWPRLAGLLLLSRLIYQLARERRCKLAAYSSAITALLFLLLAIGAPLALVTGRSTLLILHQTFGASIFFCMIFVTGGLLHQIHTLHQARTVGAVSLKKEGYCFLKDVSCFAVGLTIGASHSVPILVAHGIGASLLGCLVLQIVWLSRGQAL